jgi:hypothetical protein
MVEQGKVPKNSYGNVNMFKESMCPIGGVHIPSKELLFILIYACSYSIII